MRKNNEIKDERLEIEERKINSEGFVLAFLGMAIIIIYRLVISGEDFSEIVDISILFLVVTFYVTIRSMTQGSYGAEYEQKKKARKKNILSGLLAAIIFSIILAIWEIEQFSITRLIFGGVIFFIVWIFIQELIQKISYKKLIKDRKDVDDNKK